MKSFILVVLTNLLMAQQSHAGYYQDLLVCNDGAARVQVDLGERKNVRLLVFNQEIKNYFVGEITKLREDVSNTQPYRGYLGEFFPMDYYNKPQTDKEMTVNGISDYGIFRAGDFRELKYGKEIFSSGVTECMPHSGNGCAGSLNGYFPSVVAKRQGLGLKVEIWRPRNFGRLCLESNSDLGCSRYTPVMGWEAVQMANWYFERCEQKEILP